MRSYNGCATCRRRKLKCDEAKPVCGQCRKGSRDCVFAERRVFRNFDGEPASARNPRFRRETTGTFDHDHVWIPVPRDLTFVHVNNPYELGPTAELHNEVSRHSSPGGVEDSPPAQGAAEVDETLLTLRLLRHFKDGPGQWMDLLDTTAYFSCQVPRIATRRPLLKSAVCALAAKHLRHIQRSNNTTAEIDTSLTGSGDGQHRLNSPATSPHVGRQVDWGYQSAKFYHQALGHLKTAVNCRAFDVPADREELFAAVAILCCYELMGAPGTAWRAHLSALPLFSPGPDPTSAAPCSPVTIPPTPIKGPIFWHLARQDLLCAFISETQTRLDIRDLRLWQNAGLATDEHGFLLPFSPSASSSADARNGVAEAEEDARSNELTWLMGKIANHLTSGDAINPEDYALPRGQRPSIGVTQEQLLERWNLLTNELQRWHASLPATFIPSARTRHRPVDSVGNGDDDDDDRGPSPSRPSRSRTDNHAVVPGQPPEHPSSPLTTFDQIWYDLPLCAGTMQNYHMACILLLANRPQESTAIRSTVSARLKSYRHIQVETLRHAREICGICLADPTDALRIHAVQPLFVAGQVFHEPAERGAVLEMLRGVERDVGWTTSWHATKLVDEWPGYSGERTGGRTGWTFS